MKKWLYELIYRIPFMSIDKIFGSASKLERFLALAIDGRIPPGKAITLGCGVGRETIYLAKQGFEVIGVDFSPAAIKRARKNAQATGVQVQFIEDDLTNLRHVSGSYDLVTDFGALNDLSQEDRDLYMHNVIPLTHPGGHYLMFCFDSMLHEDEVHRRFHELFKIETLDTESESRFPGPLHLYLMTREEQNLKEER